MLTSYTLEGGTVVVRESPTETDILQRAVWIDLLDPTPAEEQRVQRALQLEVPTREEMQEIESSSRLYKEGETLFLTAPFLYGADHDFSSTPITFVLGNENLVTVRYATPRAFASFSARCQRTPGQFVSPDSVMLHLFEQVVDRLADILEKITADMDRASGIAFRTARAGPDTKSAQKSADLKGALISIGQVGEVTSRANETLLGVSRIMTFLSAEKANAVRKENLPLMKSLVRDVRSLVEHAAFINSKANFLLDAVLGMINVEQSTIIKTFTVASVALMPPTLIASIYGMNFEHMPELRWVAGYPIALVLMVVSAVLPILYFKRRGWL